MADQAAGMKDIEAIIAENDGPIKDANEEGTRLEINHELNRRVLRGLDLRVLPIVCMLYVLSYLDRGNIGNAKTAGAKDDLGLSSMQWSWVLNSFYIAYISFEWSTTLWKIFPAHIYVACLCVLWGTAAMCSGLANNLAQLVACRTLLGIFEATFGAGAPYFLSLLYKRRELGLRMSFLLSMSPVANTFASSLAYGITHINSSIHPWRLLLLIEGAPTIMFAPVVYFFLIDSPGTAKFFSQEERTYAVERMQVIDKTEKRGIQWKQVLLGIVDYKNYMHGAMHFCTNFSFAALSNFLPTIVQNMGYSSINAQGLTAPVYLGAALCCLASAYASDRYGNRGFIIAGFAAIGAVGYGILAGVHDSTGVRYFGVWCAACGVFPALSLNITWLLNNQGGDSKKGAGLGIVLIVGQCSSLISSVVFPNEDAPNFIKGNIIGCAFTGCIVFMALIMHFLLHRENRRRDGLYGPVDADIEVDVTHEGDNHRNFRYLT